MTKCIIGIDGGGTKTDAIIGSVTGDIMGHGHSGPCNIAAMSPEDALRSVTDAIANALVDAETTPDNIAGICACVAGYSAFPKRLALMEELGRLFPAARIDVEADYAAALTGGTGGKPGLVVIAGTGSVAYGENAYGQSVRAGAYGYLIDDSGSGYGVGREAIAAVLRQYDGTGPETRLTPVLHSVVGISSPLDLISEVYGGKLDRVAIASLAETVSREAAEGDEVARKILHRTGGALAVLAEAAARTLFPDTAFPIITVGSLWQAGPALTDVFARSVTRFAPKASISPPILGPVEGALFRAVQHLSSS